MDGWMDVDSDHYLRKGLLAAIQTQLHGGVSVCIPTIDQYQCNS